MCHNAFFGRRRRLRKITRVTSVVLLLCGIKVLVHLLGLERIQVNQLFSAMVASTVFLLGFLLSGVLADFKESEKIPGELSTSLESLFLEVRGIRAHNPEAKVNCALCEIVELGGALLDWIQGRIALPLFRQKYWTAHREVVFAATQFKSDSSTLKGRFMQEMSLILQKTNRVHTIRETSFVPLVYWMADIASLLLFMGLIFAKSENLLESVFFLGVISFLVVLLIRLIEDIDNPFGWSEADSAEDVSIELLEETVNRLRVALAAIGE